ncbi:MAG: tetratricopeptide repeat protein [Myxococcaceae bacterium]|nr:tetratricopeptide repeat protein [Myxococcaceae bacterium]
MNANEMNALMSQAETYLTQRDVDRAVLIVQEAKRLEPGSLEPDAMMASISLHLGRVDDAQTILDGIIQRQPKHARARLLRGLVHEVKEQLDDALASFELATRFSPESMPAWFNRGRLMLRTKRVAEAAIAFEKAAGLAPENVAVLAAWAQTLVKLGYARRAANVYLRCIEQNVANPIFLIELAELLVNANERPLAEEVLAAGSRVYESQGLFESKLAALALEKKAVDAAAHHAKEAVRRQPDCVEFLLGLAVIETMRLKLDDARLLAERALKVEPTSWRANHQLGIVFEAAKLKEKACSFYRTACELAPDQWEPRNNLAVLLLEAKTPAAAREAKGLLEEAVRLGAPNATPHLNLALALLQMGQRARAKAVATQAAGLGGHGNQVSHQASELAAALG